MIADRYSKSPLVADAILRCALISRASARRDAAINGRSA
jgi:hypothetical protein